MSCTTEEECRRQKIIKDSQVATMASRGIGMSMRGELSIEQLKRLIALDERYLADTVEIAPGLEEGRPS